MLNDNLAFIFDMDGVIVHSTPAHTEAWRRYLRAHELEIPSLEARMLGKRNDEIVRDFFPNSLTPQQIFDHGAGKEALYREMMAPVLNEHIVPGLPHFLDEHRHVKIGLATNAEPANVDFILTGASIADYFLVRVDGHQVERPKPYPDIYLLAAKRLGVSPQQCIVFEDSLTGVEAARAAGMLVVGLTTTLPELPGANLLIRDFNDSGLRPWLSSMYSVA